MKEGGEEDHNNKEEDERGQTLGITFKKKISPHPNDSGSYVSLKGKE